MTSEWLVDGRDVGVRLDKFLAAPDRLGSRGRAVSALGRGKVIVNGADTSMQDAGRRLVEGDLVRVWIDRPGSAAPRLLSLGSDDLPIVYEDASLLVLNKPAGLLAVPLDRRRDAASVYDRIRDRLRSHARRTPFVVHRIDRDTSGLVVFARTASAQAALKAQFRRREPERVYCAVVHGRPDPQSGTWRDHLSWDRAASIQKAARAKDPGAKEAISHYRVVETFPAASLLEVRLETGKQNQIRIQACLHGHPLVGERRYVLDGEQPGGIAFPRQALHAQRLGFRHPVDGRALAFEAPLPGDLRALLRRLRRG
jgi:23S rRNA pseudouridine1911/1915/1917 synthase